MAEAPTPPAPSESPELAALRQRYLTQRQALRWSSRILAGAWGGLFAVKLLLAVNWDWLVSWLYYVRVSDISYLNTRYDWIMWLGIAIGFLASLATIYFLYRLWRTQRAFHRLWQPTPPVAYVSTPAGQADQPADQDALGFEVLAQAIGGLLSHPATQAPYSLVLSGGWGAGKSSLMAQVRRRLTAPGAGPAFQSLWFNVWHFQSEQHLLATFLGAILARCEELPGFYRRLWWQRLLGQGFGEALRTAFVLGLGLLVGGALLLALLQKAGLSLPFAPVPLAALFGAGAAPGDKPALLAVVAAWAGAAWSLLKTWQERSTLLAGLVPMERFRLEAARADAGFRRKYQQEFRQLMRATPPGTRFLIFIDDVDRIPGSRVLELLESINFISDTASRPTDARPDDDARLYFVLGMYVPEVARTLGEALDPKGRLPEEQATRHAARYLAKLVDLVVPLPSLQHCTPAQLHHLLFGSAGPAPRPTAPAATPPAA